MVAQTLYSLRTDGDQYRITKFTDGEVESSYLCTEIECECPAGVRPSCRHRQMLPQMIAHGILNTHWFWDHSRGYACDFQGGSKALVDQLAAAEMRDGLECDELILEDEETEEDTITQPHSPMATTTEFDSVDVGSIPAGVAKSWRRF